MYGVWGCMVVWCMTLYGCMPYSHPTVAAGRGESAVWLYAQPSYRLIIQRNIHRNYPDVCLCQSSPAFSAGHGRRRAVPPRGARPRRLRGYFEEAFAEQQGYNSVAMLRAYCVCARLRGAFKTQLVVNTGKARSSKSIFAETCEKVASTTLQISWKPRKPSHALELTASGRNPMQVCSALRRG